jgi:hypothetical protein
MEDRQGGLERDREKVVKLAHPRTPWLFKGWEDTYSIARSFGMDLKISLKSLPAILLLGVLAAGCAKGSSQSAGNEPAQTGGEKQELSIEVPESGSLPDRVRSLWTTTLPIIRKDASAGLSDADYQTRRLPLFSAWVTLQQQNASAPKTDDRIGELIPRIPELVDHVYGFPGTPAGRRIKERQNKGRTDYLIADIEKQVRALPK